MATEHILENRRYWDGMAHDWVSSGERNWQQAEPTWGIWGIPEAELSILPANMQGMRAVELGCGTGYVSAWMARRGAYVVGIDNSAAQLRSAQRFNTAAAAGLELLHANAEAVPCADGSFDFAISEYGAAIWCDPYRWLPEAQRILRPRGTLVFLGCHPLHNLCTPATGTTCDAQLHRPYFGLHSIDWRHVEIDPGGVEFNLTFSAWLALFRELDFEVLNYRELAAPADAAEQRFQVPAQWGRQWPAEQVWWLRRSE